MKDLREKDLREAWLASAEVPYGLLIPLLHDLGGAGEVYDALIHRKDLPQNLLPLEYRERLLELSGGEKEARRRALLEQHAIRTFSILDPEYPHCLRQIKDPPGILFYQGNLSCLRAEKKAAMVGSRSASYNGLKETRKIARDLSRAGVTVISGLASGVDAEAHRGCLEGKSPTVAVMGCGLDGVYPSENASLRREILEKGGLLISEYAPEVKPLAFHFPYRNRIISGLADCVILMEAKIRSGSMTTVDHALRQGREVFVYPGDPTSPLFAGNRSLLRDGARYFTTGEDVLSDMNWLDNLPHVGQNSVCSVSFHPESPAEAKIFSALEKGSLSFEQILGVTDLSSPELMSALTLLQIRGKIDALPGKRYQLRR